MRKINFLLMLLCLIASQQLAAYDFIKNGIAYSVTNAASRTVAVVPADSMYGGNIVIPATVTHDNITYTITSIGDKAFNNYSGIYDENQKLLSVSIPKYVKTIGVEAFRRCVNLKSVNFASDAQLETIGVGAYFHCDSLKEIDLPDSVKVIAGESFAWSGLERIYIGPKITTIGDPSPYYTKGGSFNACHNLKRIDISDIAAYCNISYNDTSLPNWGKNFYLNGQLITDLVIPKSVTKIANNSFYGWQGNSVTFPASIEEIGKKAFYGSSIKEVNFPNKTRLQVLGNNAFSHCDSLLRVDLPKSDSLYAAGSYYSDGYWHDGDAFTSCQSLETITVSPSVMVINFSCNPKLKNVIFPSDCHVTQINSKCFQDCHALETFEIPNSVTSIGQAIFQSCSSLKKVIIPASVTELSTAGNLGGSYKIHSEFVECDSLKEVYCYITEPFATGEPYWNDYNWVENVTLYVPQGTKEKYESLYSWNFFGNIMEMGVNVDSLKISKSSLTLTLGKKDTLTVEVYPDNATHKDVVWSISDSTVAKVDNGIVTSIGIGSATITATTTDGTNKTASCTVTVKSTYTVGDINNDKELNVGDLSRLVKMILDEYSTQDDTFKAADVNGDGELNVGDYSKLVKMILDAPAAGSKAFQGAALSKGYRSAAVSLTSDDIAIGAGQTKLLAVQLSNYDEAFNAVQFDIQLPKDLEIDSEATETAARTSGFGIATNGTRVILSNTRDQAISGSVGDILYLAVKANADIQLGSYEVEFDNVLLSTMESEVVRADGFYSTIMAEDLTGISSATSNINPKSSKVYDLQGRKVNGKSKKGIYIVNGKKRSL